MKMILVVLALTACSPTERVAGPTTRPARWAVPVAIPGLPNFHRVNEHYYRGAQPTAEGLRELAKLGVRTIINLRVLHSDHDKIEGLPFAYEHISFKTWHAEDEDVIRFLRLVTDPDRQPVFVHCKHGADRTGMMTAIYRIVVEGWSKDDAIAEMTQGEFGYHEIWTNLITYIRELDVEKLRRELGKTK